MEERRARGNKLKLLSQALLAASHSLDLAKQLISEIERSGSVETPGLVGRFDGRFMVTKAGKKYPVPDNYAAKTKLIYGDKLKMVEGHEGRRFKHIMRIPRVEVEATLTVKDGQFVAVTPEGSYRIFQSAVRYFKGEEGGKVKILLPRDEKHAPFAAVLGMVGRERPKVSPRPDSIEPKRAVKQVVAGEEAKPAKEEAEKGEKVEEKKGVKEDKKEDQPKVQPKADEPGVQKKREAPVPAKVAKAAADKKPAKAPVKKKAVVKKKPPAKPPKTSPAKKGGKVAVKKGELKIEPPGKDELV